MNAKTYVIQTIDSMGVWRDSWSTCEPTIAAGAMWESTPAGWSRPRADLRIARADKVVVTSQPIEDIDKVVS